MAGPAAAQVAPLYHYVIDDVINNLREVFLDEGVDEQVLQDIKSAWSKKIEDSGVLTAAPQEPTSTETASGSTTGATNSKTDKTNNSQKSSEKNKKNNSNTSQNNSEIVPTTSGTSVITSNPQHKKNGGTNAGTKRANASAANKNTTNNTANSSNNNNTDNTEDNTGTPSKKPNIVTPAPIMNQLPVNVSLTRPNVPVMSANANMPTTVRTTMTQNIVSQAQPTIVNPGMNKNTIFRPQTIVNAPNGPNGVRPSFIQPTILTQNGQRLMILNNNQMNQPYIMSSQNGQIMLPMLNVAGGTPQLLTNSTLMPGAFYTQMPGGVVQQIRPMPQTSANAQPVQRNIASKKANQVDGVDEISSDDDLYDEEDYRDQFEDLDDDENLLDEEENPSVVEDEEPLNSGDDVSEEDSEVIFETDNVIVCQYEKITRSRNRWKFAFKDGIMNIAGKDYIFHKSVGDAEW